MVGIRPRLNNATGSVSLYATGGGVPRKRTLSVSGSLQIYGWVYLASSRASDGRRQTSRASSYLFFKAILLQKSPFPGKKSARGAPFRKPRYARRQIGHPGRH